jgi:hypothetical protein
MKQCNYLFTQLQIWNLRKTKDEKQENENICIFHDSRITSIFILFDIQNVLYNSVSPWFIF